MIDKATDLGVTTDINIFAEPAQRMINTLKSLKDPEYVRKAEAFQKRLNEKVTALGPKYAEFAQVGYKPSIPGKPFQSSITPRELSELQERYYKTARRGYKKGSFSNEAIDFYKALGRGSKEALESAVEAGLGPGQGQVLANLTEPAGSLLTAGATFDKNILKTARRQPITEMDFISLYDKKLAALKAAGKAIKNPYVLTKGGNLLMDIGGGLKKVGSKTSIPALLNLRGK